MDNIFLCILLVSLFVLVVGVISPKLIKFSSRGKVVLVFGGITIVSFVLFGITSPTTPKKQVATTSVVPASSSSAQVTQPVAQPVSAPIAVQPQVLLDISGSGSKSTKTFTVPDEWTMDWSYDCSNFGDRGNFQVFIYNSGGSMSFENTGVNQLGKKDSSTEYYHSGGTYYLQVNSECKWNLQVKG